MKGRCIFKTTRLSRKGEEQEASAASDEIMQKEKREAEKRGCGQLGREVKGETETSSTLSSRPRTPSTTSPHPPIPPLVSPSLEQQLFHPISLSADRRDSRGKQPLKTEPSQTHFQSAAFTPPSRLPCCHSTSVAKGAKLKKASVQRVESRNGKPAAK